ncbi:hypothetical protein [Halobacillus halophilus]|uniref:hypothetical protein n=1 Tax=Halobacillus halophilus TaxID=1570 RepID=UPI001CD46CF6|nr:hypothetical protein [Halobacillus halophilus]MCA1010871.1 hypothetical protein [Halobacillus halophilus]
MNQTAKTLAVSGVITFLAGIGLLLLDFLSAFHFLIPLLTLGGICMVVISVFLSSNNKHKKSR